MNFQLDVGFEETSAQLRELLFEAVQNAEGDSILLSGGLDTSIIAGIEASLGRTKLHAVTVILEDAPAPDLNFSKLVAKNTGFPKAS